MLYLWPHWVFPDCYSYVSFVFFYTPSYATELFLNGYSLGISFESIPRLIFFFLSSVNGLMVQTEEGILVRRKSIGLFVFNLCRRK